jgi:hypothetical protein
MTDRSSEEEAEALHRREIDAIEVAADLWALWSNRELYSVHFAEAVHEAVEEWRERSAARAAAAAEAKREWEERPVEDEVRALANDVVDPEDRYKSALAEIDEVRDPNKSFAGAIIAEYDAFRREQEALGREIAGEADPDRRRSLELRKEIETLEYLDFKSKRLATAYRTIPGNEDDPEAALDEAKGDAYKQQASALRHKRVMLLYERVMRDRAPAEARTHEDFATACGSNAQGEPSITGMSEFDARALVDDDALAIRWREMRQEITAGKPAERGQIEDAPGSREISDVRARRIERLRTIEGRIEDEDRGLLGRKGPGTNEPGGRSR